MTTLKDIKVDARIILASHRLRLRELLRLERGSIVPLDGTADSLSTMVVNGVAVALGKVMIDGERTAFEIHDVTERG